MRKKLNDLNFEWSHWSDLHQNYMQLSGKKRLLVKQMLAVEMEKKNHWIIHKIKQSQLCIGNY